MLEVVLLVLGYLTQYFHYNFTVTGNVLTLQASCERRTNCADSATYEVTDPEPEPKPNPNAKTHPNPNPIF